MSPQHEQYVVAGSTTTQGLIMVNDIACRNTTKVSALQAATRVRVQQCTTFMGMINNAAPLNTAPPMSWE